MRCCGQDVDSPFCPNCGKENAQLEPLVSLLRHIESTLPSIRKIEEALKERLKEKPSPRGVRWIKRKQDLITKWESWRDAVKSAIERSKT